MGKDEGGKGGVVVNISSIAGLAPFECSPVYVATKHAVIGLTRSFGVSTACSNVDILYWTTVAFCSLCSFLVDSPAPEYYTPTFRNTLCVPKRRHIKFRHQRITQKKEHNFQNKAEV